MQKQTNRLATLTLGIFAALAILFSHSFSYQPEPIEKNSEAQEQTENGTSVQTAPATVSGPQASVQSETEPSVIQVWVREVKQKALAIVTENASFVFRHLVGASISPQAP